jgi:hypothetical protein
LDAISNNHGMEQTILFGSFYQSQVTIWNCSARLNTRGVTVKLGKFKEGWPTGPGIPWGLIGMGLPTYSNSTPLLNMTYSTALFNLWNILDPVQPNISSVTEHYLSSGVVSVSTILANLSNLNLTTNDLLAQGFTALFNTVWILAFSNYFAEFNTSSTVMMQSPRTPIVVCSWLYFIILTGTSLFLISYTILNAWLRYHTVIPDSMGYVSSMTIENPYISIPGIIPGAGSTLSGMERTKLLRSMRVRIGDVHPGQEFGKLVLARESRFVAKVERKRMFV